MRPATVNVAASTAPCARKEPKSRRTHLRHQLTLLARRLERPRLVEGRLQLRQRLVFFGVIAGNRVEQAADQRNRVFRAELASAADCVEQSTGVVSDVAQPFPIIGRRWFRDAHRGELVRPFGPKALNRIDRIFRRRALPNEVRKRVISLGVWGHSFC